ncbi:glycerol-3-phosphate dehydrogenase [Sphingorhabdus sp. Alg239-R122]|uniref:glycerol-3-phosphate dehydrogenase n=1 Tax=Sphingorhabdus sp. Alg239-R122 TaxID=2305989 RepID=UPI0013DB7E8F|nr:glycerol-3-phosphate dehydrogenase [Sphingorhabdus sp. Alg239-R122]
MTDKIYDLLIIGGGINGAAIARDAAGRGLSVLLCEKGDLAGETSSASSKLVHGGLRYLEHMEFRLVREALQEREILLKSAPHIIWPLRIVLPHDKGLRPAWLLRLGLFIYDHLGTRKILPGTKTVKLSKAPHAGILQNRLTKGFEFSDCWADDARLVALNALDAHAKGAQIRTRTECTALHREEGLWTATLMQPGGTAQTIRARIAVNAAGMMVDNILDRALPGDGRQNLRLVKGSHIVTRKLYDGDHLYMFQNADERIVFAIPYENDFTLIGTTDAPYKLSDGEVKISEAETDYLCDVASEYFKQPVTRGDIVWTYAGVRPLYDDKSDNASTVTRDYVFDLNTRDSETDGEGAPLLSIFGGKITTCRRLAEHAMQKLGVYLDDGGEPWTSEAHLPGGHIPNADFDAFFAEVQTGYPWMNPAHLERMAHCYGTRLHAVIGNCTSAGQLGQYFGAGLYEAEARYLMAHEWARHAEDILWRRTKCGLHMDDEEIAVFERWVAGAES